ncbi:hypothetical protein HDV57DRAFT_513409 [Trichoderma longibrachiatum]
MPSGRRPTLGDEIADAYIFPQCTRRARPRIPAICVASPSGEVRLVVDIRPPRLDGPIEKQRRRRLRESLAEYEEELREEEEEPREEEAARDRGRVETCLVDQTDKPPEAKPTANKRASEEKPPPRHKAPEARKPPTTARAPLRASAEPVRPGTFRTFLAYGRQLIFPRRTHSRRWRGPVMG